jgi:hypothetical protein
MGASAILLISILGDRRSHSCLMGGITAIGHRERDILPCCPTASNGSAAPRAGIRVMIGFVSRAAGRLPKHSLEFPTAKQATHHHRF